MIADVPDPNVRSAGDAVGDNEGYVKPGREMKPPEAENIE